ncbi:MAG: magnesium transporter, partial [Clostridia bacterium]|nr:magnesium transporter [Clostridia bacterium]
MLTEMIEELSVLLENREFHKLRSMLSEYEAADIAALFAEMPPDTIGLLFRLLPKEPAAEVFVELDTDLQQALIQAFSDAELEAVFDELFVDDMVDIIEEMPANVVKRILDSADRKKRAQINKILNYPKYSAGSLMTTEFVELKTHMTCEDVFKNIKRSGVKKETIYDCYVTDSGRRLIGVLSVKDLLLAEEETETVENLMLTEPISVGVLDDEEAVAATLKKYGFMALPVVDAENRLVGIITYDDAMDVLEESSSEDMEMMAAITPTDKPYLKNTVWETWKNRIPWLLILMLSSTFTSKILQHFEDALVQCAALTAFIPMLMGTGGNAGGQVSVTVIRGLSLGEIRMGDVLRILWKELRVALLAGGTLAVVNFCKML